MQQKTIFFTDEDKVFWQILVVFEFYKETLQKGNIYFDVFDFFFGTLGKLWKIKNYHFFKKKKKKKIFKFK